jgi:2-oxoglutarate ferredoxin oxidoreductase subunit gamma
LEKTALFAGYGGQGVMLMGQLLGHAAMAEQKEVVLTQSYGNEMRGGTAHCSVIISDRKIGSPCAEKPDGCVVMNPDSLERFGPMVRSRGVLILNSSLINVDLNRKNIRSFKVPIAEIAHRLGNIQVSNLVALGAFVEATQMVKATSIIAVLRSVFPKHRWATLPLNKKAFQEGGEYIKRVSKNEGIQNEAKGC